MRILYEQKSLVSSPTRNNFSPAAESDVSHASLQKEQSFKAADNTSFSCLTQDPSFLHFDSVPEDLLDERPLGGAAGNNGNAQKPEVEEDVDETARETVVLDTDCIAGKAVTVTRGWTVLGRGAFSTVYMGTICMEDYDDTKPMDFNNFRIPVAMKEMYLPVTARTLMLIQALIEIRTEINHRNLVKMLFFHISDVEERHGTETVRVVMGMEVAFDGDINSLRKQNEKLEEEELRSIALDVLEGLEYFHLIGMVHNDIKPHNLLACRENFMQNSGRRVVKLTDLTCAAFSTPVETIAHKLNSNPKQVLESSVALYLPGTALYMSPESCLGMSESTGNDVWSLGITLFHLATGHHPWTAMEAAHPVMIVNGYRAMYERGEIFSPVSAREAPQSSRKSFGPLVHELQDASTYSPAFCDFVCSCLKEDILERPSVLDLKKHPFLAVR